MDWHKKYKVLTNVGDNTLEFTTQGQRYKTIVEYGHEEQVNAFECFYTEFVVEEEEPRPLAYLAQPEPSKTPSKILKEKREALLTKFPNIIFKDEKTATITPLVRCKLYPKHNRPIREEVRNLGFHKRQWLIREIDELLKAGIIKPSRSRYAVVAVIVDKKDSAWRLAIDYRRVNEATEDFLYPLPKIAEIFDSFTGA